MYDDDSINGTHVLLAFLAGTVAGAAIALLSAPQTGSETRQSLRGLASGAGDRASTVPDTLRGAYGKAASAARDAFSRALSRHGVRAQASHNLLPQEQPTAEEIIAAAESADLDTVLVTRYIGESTEDIYHPGKVYYGIAPAYGLSHYDRFGRYYGHAYEVAYQQPVWTSNVTHTLVSDLYVAATREHLWQAVSETLQAGSNEQLRDDAIKCLIGNMK